MSTEPTSNIVELLNDGDWYKEIDNYKAPVLVEFYAPWCAPCTDLSAVLDKTSKDFPEVKVLRYNMDKVHVHATILGVTGIPTILLMKPGKDNMMLVFNRITGYLSYNVLSKKIKEFLNKPNAF